MVSAVFTAGGERFDKNGAIQAGIEPAVSFLLPSTLDLVEDYYLHVYFFQWKVS